MYKQSSVSMYVYFLCFLKYLDQSRCNRLCMVIQADRRKVLGTSISYKITSITLSFNHFLSDRPFKQTLHTAPNQTDWLVYHCTRSDMFIGECTLRGVLSQIWSYLPLGRCILRTCCSLRCDPESSQGLPGAQLLQSPVTTTANRDKNRKRTHCDFLNI